MKQAALPLEPYVLKSNSGAIIRGTFEEWSHEPC